MLLKNFKLKGRSISKDSTNKKKVKFIPQI